MNIFFTSDHHFNHTGIIKHTNRPFYSKENMDEEMLWRWNSVVKSRDEVYYLGDLTLGNWKSAEGYIKSLNGSIKFLEGNHDGRWFSKLEDNKKLPPIHELKINKQMFILCHYSMRVWNGFHRGSIHLFGHSHGSLRGTGRSMDIGVDSNNFYPVSIDEVLDRMKGLEYG